MSTDADFADVVEERLDAVLARPSMWGGPEAVELQVLLLLELRIVAACPALRHRAPEIVMRLHSALVRRRFPGAGPTLLAGLIDGTDDLARELQVLRKDVISSLADPDRFPVNDQAPPVSVPDTLGVEDVAVPRVATSPGPMPRRLLGSSSG